MRIKTDYSRHEALQPVRLLQGLFILKPPSVFIVRMLIKMKTSQSYAVIILKTIIVLSEIVINWKVLRMPP